MGNFLPNQVVVAAKDKEMLSLLKVMAFNIATWERDEFNEYPVDERLTKCLNSAKSAEKAYGLISGLVEDEYTFCFTPSLKGANEWLEEHRENLAEICKENPIIKKIVDYLTPPDGNLDKGFTLLPNNDRYDSDTAGVSMDRYGTTYVLRLSYCTRTIANFESVDCLFEMLGLDPFDPDGYGLSEMCDYETDEGVRTMIVIDSTGENYCLDELIQEAKDNADMDLAKEEDLNAIAWHVAECRWGETRWDFEEPLDTPELYSSDKRKANKGSAKKKDKMSEDAEWIFRLLPETISIEGTGYLGRAERVEKLAEGDRLVVAGDWDSEYFDPVCLEVFNERGETLGNLSIGRYAKKYGTSIAKILPDLVASVEKTTPLSERKQGSRYPLLDVRLDLAPGVTREQFVSDFIKNKDIPTSGKILLSGGTKLTAQDLAGSIDVSCLD